MIYNSIQFRTAHNICKLLYVLMVTYESFIWIISEYISVK